jgi:hypothetical protein
MYDPVANNWTTMASMQRPRMYHSSSVLLPDGRVLTAGTDGEFTAEIYSPPYLFQGPRRVITSAPSAVAWGSNFFVGTHVPSKIDKVVLIRPSAVTHSINMEQRAIELDFGVGGGGVTVGAPPNGGVAPPGYYMLFLVNDGVPSTAAFIKIGSAVGGDGGPPGDVDCTATIDSIDALKVLRHSAGLSVEQVEPCGNIGTLRGDGRLKGDTNCSGTIDATDALNIVRYVAGLPVALPPGCPPIGPP